MDNRNIVDRADKLLRHYRAKVWDVGGEKYVRHINRIKAIMVKRWFTTSGPEKNYLLIG
jgi:hypothetical protein